MTVNFRHVIHETETSLKILHISLPGTAKKAKLLDLTSGFEIGTFMVKKESQIQKGDIQQHYCNYNRNYKASVKNPVWELSKEH